MQLTDLAKVGGGPRGFACLCEVAPQRASTAKAGRHRLNPGGDRQANSALYIVAMSRLRRAVVPNVMNSHHSVSTRIPVRILEQQWSASVSPRCCPRPPHGLRDAPYR